MAPKWKKNLLIQARLHIWAETGELKYGFRRDELSEVAQIHFDAGTNPSGYLYPELHQLDTMPAELKKVIEAKAKFHAQPAPGQDAQ